MVKKRQSASEVAGQEECFPRERGEPLDCETPWMSWVCFPRERGEPAVR